MHDPSTVIVCGNRGVGKTTLLNMLAGRPAFPPSAAAAHEAPITIHIAGVFNEENLTAPPGCKVHVTLPDSGSQQEATLVEIARIGTPASRLVVPAAAQAIAVTGPAVGAAVTMVEWADKATSSAELPLPSATLIVGVVDANMLVTAKRRRDVRFGDVPARLVLDSGLVVLNVRHELAAGSEEATRLRSLASTLLGMECERVFATNLRRDAAEAMVAQTAPDTPLRQAVVRLSRRSPRDAASSSPPVHATTHTGGDRYMPKILTAAVPRESPASATQVAFRADAFESAAASVGPDRYAPKVLSSAAIAAQVCGSLAQYIPKAATA